MKMTGKNKLHLPKPNAQTGWVREQGRLDLTQEQLTRGLVEYNVNDTPLEVWLPEYDCRMSKKVPK